MSITGQQTLFIWCCHGHDDLVTTTHHTRKAEPISSTETAQIQLSHCSMSAIVDIGSHYFCTNLWFYLLIFINVYTVTVSRFVRSEAESRLRVNVHKLIKPLYNMNVNEQTGVSWKLCLVNNNLSRKRLRRLAKALIQFVNLILYKWTTEG